MTREEIERHEAELQDILARYEDAKKNGTGDAPVREELRGLARKTGASRHAVWGITDTDATVSQLAYNIHQALQTHSMIDACRTGAENVRLAENAQKMARGAQRCAFLSMLAAWAAVVVSIVITTV
jgi:hypothetical protein